MIPSLEQEKSNESFSSGTESLKTAPKESLSIPSNRCAKKVSGGDAFEN